MKRYSWVALIAVLVFVLFSDFRSFNTPSARFAELPVLHNGRFKPMGTLARASLLSIQGKQTVRTDSERFDAVQWLLMVFTDPEKADLYPVFRVDHPGVLTRLDIRETGISYTSFKQLLPFWEQIEKDVSSIREVPAHQRNAYQLALTRLYSQMQLYFQLRSSINPIGRAGFFADILEREASLDVYLKLLHRYQKDPGGLSQIEQNRLDHYLRFFIPLKFSSDNAAFFPIVSVGGFDEPSQVKSMGGALLTRFSGRDDLQALSYYISILSAYEKGQMDDFEAGVDAYLAYLELDTSGGMSMIKIEHYYNLVRPFFQVMIIYLVAFVFVLFGWLVSRPFLEKIAFYLVGYGVVVQTVGLLVRMWLQGRPPVTNLYSSALFVGWISILVALILERYSRKGIGTLVASLIGFLTLFIANQLSVQGDSLEMMQAVLDSNFWLATHVVLVCMGYGGAILTGFLAHIYILKGIFSRSFDRKMANTVMGMVFGATCFTLLFMFVGTILGGIWADQSWGRFWGWDPKENGAVLLVLWTVVMLHARWGGFVGQRGFMMMAVFNNIVLAFSWFGVNMLGVGLHSYGFMSSAVLWLALFIFSQLVVIWLGILPKKYWRGLK